MIRDFWYEHGEDILTIALVICVVASAFWGIIAVEKQACEIKTAGMQRESQWSLLGDCQVKMQDGTWMPLENFYIQAIEGK